jgi:hypothetical protein
MYSLVQIIKIYKLTKDNNKFYFSLNHLIIIIFSIIIYVLLIRQSLYVPSNNLDQYLIWPDTYNAIAQAGEITNHGPTIFPFVADAQVPLKYHWGAFSLGSFISFFGTFELVVSIFKTQFIFLGILYFSLLYISGRTIGKSWIAGLFSLILGGLTIYPTFPELNEQIGLARPFISSTSMPQFTANIFAILAIFFLYNFLELKINRHLISTVIFFITLSATLSKGPVGLLILILIITYSIFNSKIESKKYILHALLPSLIGFIYGYSLISSSSSSEARNGTTLWLNASATLKLLSQGYGISLDKKSIIIFLLLFLTSFSSLLIATFHSIKRNTANLFLPLVITTTFGIGGTLLLEAWGNSQLFLLYSVIPFIGVLLASVTFYKDSILNLEKILLIFLGSFGQATLYSLTSSFFPKSEILKTFFLWIFSTIVIFIIVIFIARLSRKSSLTYLLTVSVSIGMFSGLSKFDAKAYSLPEHPYSISIGTYEIAKYLKTISNKNDLIATNRHCAGPFENQTCTARQFAISAISERRVFLEGWSYTTCPLSEPILNKYWKENSWKLNQNFFLKLDEESFEKLRKSGVDWLIVDSTRPSAKSYQKYAQLVKTEGSISLWKVIKPYDGIVPKKIDPCGPK